MRALFLWCRFPDLHSELAKQTSGVLFQKLSVCMGKLLVLGTDVEGGLTYLPLRERTIASTGTRCDKLQQRLAIT